MCIVKRNICTIFVHNFCAMLLLSATEFRNNMGKYLQMAFSEKIALKSKQGIVELKPNTEIRLNPSPSCDPWFDDSRNIEELHRAIHELKISKADLQELSDIEIKELFMVKTY